MYIPLKLYSLIVDMLTTNLFKFAFAGAVYPVRALVVRELLFQEVKAVRTMRKKQYAKTVS
jgi:hypothetical protein